MIIYERRERNASINNGAEIYYTVIEDSSRYDYCETKFAGDAEKITHALGLIAFMQTHLPETYERVNRFHTQYQAAQLNIKEKQSCSQAKNEQ